MSGRDLTPVGGDRNVLFLDEGQTIRRSSTVLVKGQIEQLVGTPLRELYEEIKKSDKGMYTYSAHRRETC